MLTHLLTHLMTHPGALPPALQPVSAREPGALDQRERHNPGREAADEDRRPHLGRPRL